ncbi:MAG: Bug family tripartite tricarboxylate transporter substrate binding protein [Xanthobacteraceae bacterium]
MHLRKVLAGTIAALISASVLGATIAANAQPGGELFRGKEITLLIGAGAGGGADVYARTFARHYGRHLPGNPAVVPKNMPGAGGLRVLNHIYNVAPKDGTEIALSLAGPVLEPLFGNKGAKFETQKFTWVGNMDSDATVCFTGKAAGIKTWQDLKGRETTFGASGPSSTASIQAKVMGALLGVNVRMIHGYQGVRTSILAIQRGELDGVCGIYMSSMRAQHAREVKSSELVVWIVMDGKRIKDFPNVPTIHELLKTDDDRKLASLIFGQNMLSRPVSAPPGLSAEVTAALRKGMTATLADAAFLEEAKKTRLHLAPMTGEETARQLQAFYKLPAAVIGRAKTIIGR